MSNSSYPRKSRSKTRRILYQMLYARFFQEIDKEVLKKNFFSWFFKVDLDEEYLEKMFDIIIKNDKFMSYVFKKYAKKFDISKMEVSYVLPIFIRLWEIFFLDEEIPIKVTLNERIEIAKIYWDEWVRKMVNWVLHNVILNFEDLKKELISFNDSREKHFFN